MRIPCPYCGSRDSREFVYRGDAAPVRPASDRASDPASDSADAMFDYLYLRDNPAGQAAATGCA
eukprot:gene14343-14467_t